MTYRPPQKSKSERSPSLEENSQATPPKPRSSGIHPELTRLPPITPGRRAAWVLLRWLARFLVRVCLRASVSGLDHIPVEGPALIVTNHLGDTDVLLEMATFPVQVDFLAKIDLYFEYPPLGKLMDAYGVIWVHRGQADRRALRAALQGLAEGRFISIAPEGRESLSGALEEGTNGAAYLALKAGVPILPVTFTGTPNARIYGNLVRLRRSDVTMTVGPPFYLDTDRDRRQAIQAGTQAIMNALARQLPPEYRGVYRGASGENE